MSFPEERPEIAFFDVETTVPSRSGQGYSLLEFGAILLCPRKLEEVRTYSTLIRPANPSLITSFSVRCNGITRDAVVSAPTFSDVADIVYDILHGRVWAGHNIERFDVARIREAFNQIRREPPEPRGIIDTLPLLTHRFGRRAGNMKMATLAKYFGLGNQVHRSLDDVKMNIEVVKHCATVLFLESTLPDIFTENSLVSPIATTRNRGNGRSSSRETGLSMSPCSLSSRIESVPVPSNADYRTEENYQSFSLQTSNTSGEVPVTVAFGSAQQDTFDMKALRNEISTDSLVQDVNMEEKTLPELPDMHATIPDGGCSSDAGFLGLDEVSVSSIRASLFPCFRGSQRLKLLHNDVNLQLRCPALRVRFGINSKFVDHAGRPRLNFVVDASPRLCQVLDACDSIARKVSVESGSDSDWRCTVSRDKSFVNHPTVRLHIPAAVNGEVVTYATDMHQKQAFGTAQKLMFSRFDAAELDHLFQPGTLVDAYFSLDPYDYQQNAGIRLVAKKLIFHGQ